MEFEKISEGIRYLGNSMYTELPGICHIDSEYEKSAFESSKIASPFYILNPFGIPGEGWAGSNKYILTNDISGNTLDEMNFVR